jgi:LemA protein
MKNLGTIIIIVILGIAALSGCSTYNTLAQKDQNVKSKWAQVQNVYQRRADLIPNLVNTVKGAADFEKSTLIEVVKARGEAIKPEVNLNADQLTPENLAKFEQAQQGLSNALSRLLVVVEKYPDLKANQNFRDLQVQLEGTENRISVERKTFNDAVLDYNSSLVTFPSNIFGGMFGFKEKAYFQATPGSDKAPEVKF